MTQNKRRADDTDREVAARLRTARIAHGHSQMAIAQRIGLTFQQVQKYEKGRNRISIGRLAEMAAAIGVPVASLIPQADAAAPPDCAGS